MSLPLRTFGTFLAPPALTVRARVLRIFALHRLRNYSDE